MFAANELLDLSLARSTWSGHAIVLRQRPDQGSDCQLPPYLIRMEVCMRAHEARLMPAKQVWPYSKCQRNDFRRRQTVAPSDRFDRSFSWRTALCGSHCEVL
jgi:hypothetical protein